MKALEKINVWPDETQCHGATHVLNVEKNRYPDIIPSKCGIQCMMTKHASFEVSDNCIIHDLL